MEVLQRTRLQTMLSKPTTGGNDATRGGGFTLDGDYVYPYCGPAVSGSASGGMLTTDASNKKKGFTLDGDYVDLEQGEEDEEKARYVGIRGLDGSM